MKMPQAAARDDELRHFVAAEAQLRALAVHADFHTDEVGDISRPFLIIFHPFPSSFHHFPSCFRRFSSVGVDLGPDLRPHDARQQALRGAGSGATGRLQGHAVLGACFGAQDRTPIELH